MNLAAALQDRALFRYLQWVKSGTNLTVENRVRESAILALWHEWIFVSLTTARDPSRIAVYIWQAPGMDRIIPFVRRLGFEVILAHRGNERGVNEVRQWLNDGPGRIVAITLDGPRGPKGIAKPGVVRLARDAGVPLRPLYLASPIAFRLPTWDGCVIPGRGEVTHRPLDVVPEHGTPEQAAKNMELALTAASQSDIARPDSRAVAARIWARISTTPLRVGRLAVLGADTPRAPVLTDEGRLRH